MLCLTFFALHTIMELQYCPALAFQLWEKENQCIQSMYRVWYMQQCISGLYKEEMLEKLKMNGVWISFHLFHLLSSAIVS